MTDARIEKTYADAVRAREFLDQARTLFEDASRPELHSESRIILLHGTAVVACDAVLSKQGLRVTSGDRSHVLRLDTALEHLGAADDDLGERLDASRARRNEASYAAGFVAEASLDDAQEATGELLALVRDFLA